MKKCFLCAVVLWGALAAAKPEKVYRFVMWRDDETGASYMNQVQRVGAAVIKDKCHYQLRFCGQAIELEKVEKICSAKSKIFAETDQVEKHGSTKRLKFDVPGVIEDEAAVIYRVELNFGSKSELLANMSKIEALQKSAENMSPVSFGKKAAFFEFIAECRPSKK